MSLNEHADKAVEDRMLQLGLEALRIAGCQLLLNPAAVKHLLNGRMSHGSQPAHQLDHIFYVNLLVGQTSTKPNRLMLLLACVESAVSTLCVQR